METPWPRSRRRRRPLDPGKVTVKVAKVESAADPAELMTVDPDEVKPGDGAIRVTLVLRNDEAEMFEPSGALGVRIVDGAGKERDPSPQMCGSDETTWLRAGNVRPGRSATVTFCFLAPVDDIPGSFLEVRWAKGFGEYLPISLEQPDATPVASPGSTPQA